MNNILIEKINKIFSKNMGAKEAAEFFGDLNIEEYDQLMEMLKKIEIPNISNETKNKALNILKGLREQLHKKIKDDKGVDYDQIKNS